VFDLLKFIRSGQLGMSPVEIILSPVEIIFWVLCLLCLLFFHQYTVLGCQWLVIQFLVMVDEKNYCLQVIPIEFLYHVSLIEILVRV